MAYSNQTTGENLSRGHYQTIPRDFISLNISSEPEAKHRAGTLMRVTTVLIQIIGPWVLIANIIGIY